MPRGRKPKPSAQKLLEGNPGKRGVTVDTAALPDGPPPVDDGKSVAQFPVPDPPAYLSKGAREEWHRLAGELVHMGLLRRVDMTAFGAACEAAAMARQAQAVIARRGMTYRAGAQIKTRPEVKIVSDAMRHLARFYSEFGLTPASRARVAHVTPMGQQQNKPEQPALPGVDKPEAPPAPVTDLATTPDDVFFRGPGAVH